jgi:hypothetical protein
LRQISLTTSETAHWYVLIGKAEHIACHLLPQGIEDYLIRLFMRVEQNECKDSRDMLAQTEAEKAECKLQKLADQCLMLCGFYPEASEEYGIAMNEFVEMGIESYKQLASIENGENEIIYSYLTKNFVQVSELLNYIYQISHKNVAKPFFADAINNEEAIKLPLKQIEDISFSSPISHRVFN